jgi:hypothetical protein
VGGQRCQHLTERGDSTRRRGHGDHVVRRPGKWAANPAQLGEMRLSAGRSLLSHFPSSSTLILARAVLLLPFLPLSRLNGLVREQPAGPIERAVDYNRLLEGEDPASRDPEDALHWLRVYEELYRFKAELVMQARRHLADLPPAAQREIKETDLAIMLTESERLYGRLQFWKERLHSLAPAPQA